MKSMHQLANGLLWASAVACSAFLSAHWFLTVVLLPTLGVMSAMLAHRNPAADKAVQLPDTHAA